MSERYTKLFSLPPDLYAQGSPLVVSAGNLLKDNQTGQVLVQLKIKNISPKTVKAATVAIHPSDIAGRSLAASTAFEYLDFSAPLGAEFGQKVPIPLPNPSTRGFTVAVQEVVFEDNSAYEGTDVPWESLPAATPLTRTLGDAELVKQYQLRFGGPCQVAPQEHKDLWRCACGAWNREDPCCACRKSRDGLFGLDLKSLTADKDARLAKEKADREAKEAAEKAEAERRAAEEKAAAERRAAEEKAAAEARAKKIKKLLAILIPAAVFCVAAILLITIVIVPNSRYNKAKALFDAGRYEEAIAAFEAMSGYKDSAAQIEAAKEAIAERERQAEEARKGADYAAAIELYTSGKYQEAIVAFAALKGYKDSATQIEKCETAIKDEKYAAAVELYTAGKYEDAIAALTALDGYKDSVAQIEKCEMAIKDEKYAAAVELYTAGKYEDAIAAFTALDGYKDSAAKIKEIKPKYYKQFLSNYGSYEQDNNTANGKEDIEWIVLAEEGNKVLVISKYALDCQQYNSTRTNVTWETCSLRKWLNGTFLNAAFSAEEQKRIISTTVTADKNPLYSTSPGNNTTDKVFLLSVTEVNKYFSSDEARMCAPTDYAIAQGTSTSSSYSTGGKATCYWWLRSPGYRSNYAAGVDAGGSPVPTVVGGSDVNRSNAAVRPALWIDLGS